ncbi:EamA family transporter [Halobacteriovorax marinus]|uniref:EamA family transporter n=1 Tax=Halobacteriovorax marinus TaxID=97084 RepID=A0A1Y5FH02_9BACT|nr:EamA family transporter [Halobacteriovorax marinus]
MTNEMKSLIYGIIGVLCFGITLPVTRYISPSFDPFFIGSARAFIAGLTAIVVLFLLKAVKPTKAQIRPLLVVTFGAVLGFPVMASFAMKYVPASHGGVVVGLLPMVTAIFGTMITKDKPSFWFWVTSVIGSILIVSFTLLKGGGHFQIGDIALFIAVLCAAIGYAVGGTLSKEMGGKYVICWATIFALPFVLYPAITLFPSDPTSIAIEHWVGLIYLSLISQLFAFFFWYKALAMGGIARISQLQLTQPVITLSISALFIGELIGLQTIVFAFLIIIVVTINKKMPIATPNS